jgi:hypothetical protein
MPAPGGDDGDEIRERESGAAFRVVWQSAGVRPSMTAMLLRPTLALGLLLGFSSCALLNQLQAGGPAGAGLVPPSVTFLGATLAGSPSQQQLAAYYCPELVSAPLGSSGMICQGFFGRRPTPADMAVSFDLRFRISNPNQIPVPLASVLAAVTVFPAATNQQLGATCVQLCPPGQPGCSGVAAPGACEASSRDVRSMNDFAGAGLNLLVANGIAAATGQPLSFQAPTVSAAAQMDVVVRFSFGPEPLLAAMRQLASQSVGELRAGHAITFAIPFRIEGTVWFDGGSFGRIALGYGPIDGSWVLPVAGLVPL